MDNLTKRRWLFLVGCMGARFGLAYSAYAYPALLPSMAILAAGIATGFLYIWANGLRKTGPEVFGEQIWWNDLRPIHGALYALFAALALRKTRGSWRLLAADALLGLAAFTNHHLSNPHSAAGQCPCSKCDG